MIFARDTVITKKKSINRRPGFVVHPLVLALLSLGVFESSIAQETGLPLDRDTTSSSILTRKSLITTGIIAHTAFTFALEYKWWWQGNYHPFGFVNEHFWHDYSLGVDKMGHFYTHHVYFHALYQLLDWGGYDESTVWWGSVTIPALYGLSLEIGDGYSSYLFSPEDLIADFLGIGYGVLQVKYPYLNNFKVKWSYYPSSHLNTFNHPFSEDYDGHIYWVSANVHDLLPASLQGYWPRFLNIAVGYGGKNISNDDSGPLRRKLAIALDYNLMTIPLNGETWDRVKYIIDLFHLPAPGVKMIQDEHPQVKPLLLN